MSDLLQIFTGNPMSTFLGKKIESATRPDLESDDWGLNMEICDIINENDDDAKDAARAIRKRLQQIEQDRNFIITNRTLTVLETCVNNCSHRFHILVMTKDFIQDLVKLIGPKNNPPIELQERVLSLIENWADAFRGQPDLNGVVSVYNDLKAKGVTFPPRDPSSRVPIQTPQRTVAPSIPPAGSVPRPDRQARPASGIMPMIGPVSNPAPGGQVMLEGDGYNKISQDLVIVQSSIAMFDDVLKGLTETPSAEADWKLAEELSVTCRQMKERIVDLIERIANEDLTIELLRLNDELNTEFIKYESLTSNRSSQAASRQESVTRPQERPTVDRPRPAPTQQEASQPSQADSGGQRPKLTGVSSNTLNELSLIDFNAARDSQTEQVNGANQPAVSSSTASRSADPFDTSNLPVSGKPPVSLADELRGLDLDTSSGSTRPAQSSVAAKGPAAKLPEEISSVREQDFAEIENWLSTDSGRDLASIAGDMPSVEPISVPNSEFDNFIASRALAGSGDTSGKSQPSRKEPEPSA